MAKKKSEKAVKTSLKTSLKTAKKTAKKTKEKTIPQVEEEVKEAVKETVSAWRRLLRPRVLITTAAFILLIVIAYFLFTLNTTISEDLVIVLTPRSAALELTHGQEEIVSFTLGTNNYFFCEATCSYRLTDLSNDNLIAEGENILLQDSKVNFSFPFTAPEKGEGRSVFTLDIVCANNEKRLCARDGETHHTSALVTMIYKLSEEKKTARAFAAENLPGALEQAKELDKTVKDLHIAITAVRGNRNNDLEGLWNRTPAIVAERDKILVNANQQRAYWDEEDYASITIPEINETIVSAQNLTMELETYVNTQHALVDELENFNDNETAIARAFLWGERKQDLDAYISAILRLARNVAAEPNWEVHARSEDFAQLLAGVNGLEGEVKNEIEKRMKNGIILLMNLTNESVMQPTSDNLAAAFTDYQNLCDRVRNALASQSFSNSTLNKTHSFLAECDVRVWPIADLEKLDTLLLTKAVLPVPNSTSTLITELAEHEAQCCLFGKCEACCIGTGCDRRTPIIFLHGHSPSERNAPEYSLEAFKAYQELLEQEELYVDAGLLTPFDSYRDTEGVWSQLAVSVSATYYYDAFFQGESYILSVAKSESIDTYAIRLKELIDTLQSRTGSDKVTIVAHSMGGLVARRYLRIFGDNDVEQLIMIATPNHGIKASVASLCPFIGADKECDEMETGSAFLAKLNDPNKQPSIPMHMILGRGCDTHGENGDGIVTVANARLDGASEDEVLGSCPSIGALHTDLLDPEKYPAVYENVKAFLNN